MKKLHLNLDSLDVETFHVAPAGEDDGGTVFAHVSRAADGCLSAPNACPPVSNTDWSACEHTCRITCGYTCDDFTCLGTCDATCVGCTGATACHESCCSDPC